VSALVAWLAVSALAAWSALGTVPRVEALMSAPVSECDATFAEVTAPSFSCFVPTLFAGIATAA
jgi:hypothetical protein